MELKLNKIKLSFIKRSEKINHIVLIINISKIIKIFIFLFKKNNKYKN